MANKIFVGNISQDTSEKDLLELFSKLGNVLSVKIALGTNGKKIGRGYVVMSEAKDMEKAITKNNNALLKGNHIVVVKAHVIDQDSNFVFRQQSRFSRYRKF